MLEPPDFSYRFNRMENIPPPPRPAPPGEEGEGEGGIYRHSQKAGHLEK